MKVTVRKAFSGPHWGNVSTGDTLDVNPGMARQLREAGLIEEVEIDVLGKPEQSLSSQVAQVSPKPSPITSESLENKVDAKSLQSTPALEQQNQTSSMDVIEDGGRNTTKKPRKKRTSGRKISGQQMN